MASASMLAGLAAAVADAGLPPVVFIPEVDSTNDEALSLASSGVPEFTAVLANVQHAGRGRRGRAWSSPPGAGMYLSVIVREDGLGANVPLVTLAAGVAVAEAVADVGGLTVELKWPNDVVIGRPWKKLAGILCEASALGTGAGFMVVGIGVNVQRAVYPHDVADRATSLDAECDRPVALAELVVASLRRVRENVGHLRAGRQNDVLDRWRQYGHAALDEQPVQWNDDRGLCRGIAYGLSDTGALLVRTLEPAAEFPRLEQLTAGDVRWETLFRG